MSSSSSTLPRRSTLWVRAFFALIFPAFFFVFPYIDSLNNPNENVRTYMALAIVEHHTFKLDKVVAQYGWVNDMARAPDRQGQQHYYCIKGPAMGYLGTPVYAAFRQIAPLLGWHPPTADAGVPAQRAWLRATTVCLRLFVVQLPCFLFLVAFERWLRRYSQDPVLRISAVAAAGIGTNYLAYSLMFVSHALFAVTSFGAFALIANEHARSLEPSGRRNARAFWAGLLAGIASMLDYQAFPISVGLALYAIVVFRRVKPLLGFVSGAGICALALMYYQWACYGNPLTPGHKFAETQAFADFHRQGFYGLTVPDLAVLRNLSFSHAYGFFGTSPFMYLGLLALPTVLVMRGSRHQLATVRLSTGVWMALMTILWLAISSAVNWRGGWVVGPRFFGAAPPFFAFGALVSLEWLARRTTWARVVARSLAVGLAVASVIQIGLVSLHFNSLPESVTRPLREVTWPLAKSGFVPYHVGDLFGVNSFWVWHAIAVAMVLALLLTTLRPAGERVGRFVPRLLLTAAIAWLGLRSAFDEPTTAEGGDHGESARQMFVRIWEPAGRDRLSLLKERARHGHDPCAWSQVAKIEQTLGLPEATSHAASAPQHCPR